MINDDKNRLYGCRQILPPCLFGELLLSPCS